MKIRSALIGVVAVALLAGCSSDDRFGDPAVLRQIESSTDCAELQQWADGLLAADPDDNQAYDQAVGYSNAASDRMDEIGC